jgi:glycosyltransferase involved in cell wall biosynthesis
VKIGINARYLSSPSRRGFNRYTAELVRALAAHQQHEILLFSDKPIHEGHALGALGNVRAVIQPEKRQWQWQHRELGPSLVREGVDVFHAPAHWGLPWHSKVPAVATIHDLADREVPQHFADAPLKDKLRHRAEEWLVVRRAARIITVSEYSARSIAKHLDVKRERIAVTVEGAAPAFNADARQRADETIAAHGIHRPFYACVGGFDARKNLVVLVEAVARLPRELRPPIVLVGAPGPAAHKLMSRAAELGVRDVFKLAGILTDDELAAILSAAVSVVTPSTLEGFGLPVVEAMHVGTPAIVSDAGSLPEIAGEAAIVCPAEDPDAFAAALRRLIDEPALRDSLAAKASARAAGFTWARCAEQTLAVYASV